MEQTNLPANPAQVTKELVKASFNIELARLNYQQTLQSVESIVWTRENINEDLLAPGKFVATKLTEQKELVKRPYIDAGKIIQNEYNDVFNPLNDAISRKVNEKKVLADKMRAEDDKANAEIARVAGIRQAITNFISTITNEITGSDNGKAIVAAEMRIGSEISRKNFYQELLPQLKEQTEELKPLIKNQKEYIRAQKELEKSKAKAIAAGDDDKAIELMSKAEGLKEIIDENKIRIQQKAFEQVEQADVAVGVPTAVAPKASRTWWTWKVDDINLLFKKKPELVNLVADSGKIDEIFDAMKAAGDFEGKREVKYFGITFYEEKSYK